MEDGEDRAGATVASRVLMDDEGTRDSDEGLEPDEIFEKRQTQVKKARKNYRMMRTYSQPYWYYYKAQTANEQKMIKLKRAQYDEMCLTVQRVGSEFNKKKDAKNNLLIKELFKEYISVKEQVAAAREMIRIRKHHQNRADTDLIRAKAKPKPRIFGRFKTLDDAYNWIQKSEEKLNVEKGLKNKIVSRAGQLRRTVSAMLSERIIYMETVDKSLNHLATGNQCMLDAIEQALVAFKRREQAMVSLQKITEKRAEMRAQDKKKLSNLSIALDSEMERAMLLTQKGQQRVVASWSEADISPEALEAIHKDLKDKMEEGYKHFLSVSGFFWTKTLDQNKVADMYNEATEENFHHFGFFVTLGVKAENSHYAANISKLRINEGKRKCLKTMRKQRNSLADLHHNMKYWESVLLQTTNDIEYSKKLKEHFFDIVGSMFFNTDLKYIIQLYPNWRSLDVLNHALVRAEGLISCAIRVYKFLHKELYEPRSKRLPKGKQRRLFRPGQKTGQSTTPFKKKKEVVACRAPGDTPCPLCVDEERTKKQRFDKHRAPTGFQNELVGKLGKEPLNFFLSQLDEEDKLKDAAASHEDSTHEQK